MSSLDCTLSQLCFGECWADFEPRACGYCEDLSSDCESDASIPPASTPTVVEKERQAPQLSQQGSVSLRTQARTRALRKQVPAEAWEKFKTKIRTLYLEERRPLREVVDIMGGLGFRQSARMYKMRFAKWGFVKNNSKSKVKLLLSIKHQRNAEGKASEFSRNGRVVNLNPYLKKKGWTEYDLVDFKLSPRLPAHTRCRTPTPPPTASRDDFF